MSSTPEDGVLSGSRLPCRQNVGNLQMTHFESVLCPPMTVLEPGFKPWQVLQSLPTPTLFVAMLYAGQALPYPTVTAQITEMFMRGERRRQTDM